MFAATLGVLTTGLATAQVNPPPLTDAAQEARLATEKELESLAIIDRKVMIPMRDGIHIPADIYRPKDTSQKYPIIWVRTPYNFNFWDIRNAVPRDMTNAVTADVPEVEVVRRAN